MDSHDLEILKAKKEIQEKQNKVFDLLNEAAFKAASKIVDMVDFAGDDSSSIQSANINLTAADKILDMTGYKVARHEIFGNIGLTITSDHADKILDAAEK